MVRLTSILLTLAPLLSAQFISPPPTSDQIQAILNQRLEQKQAVSLVAAILDPQGKRTVAAGPAKPDAIFELGSLSGTFTTLVLQTMVANGEVALTDTVSMYLPNIPSHGSKQITLLDLATHTSGLPNLPLDFPPPGPNEDPALAYTRYTDTQAMAFLASYQLTRDPGKLYEHSDLGIALLARALVRRATVSYETLLRRRILTPLGMNDTRIDLDEFQRARLAPGHIYTATGIQPRPSSDTGFFAPALGLHSTAKDLLVFVSAYLNTPETNLHPQLAATLEPRRPIADELQTALGWQVRKPHFCFRKGVCLLNTTYDMFTTDGSNRGHQVFMGFDPVTKTGAVVLSNAGFGVGVTDIGLHLLNVKLDLFTYKQLAAYPRTPIAIDAAALDKVVGRFQFPDKSIWTFRRDGTRLMLARPGELEVEFLPSSPTAFFATTGDLGIKFAKPGLIVLTTAAPDRKAKRVP